MPREIDVAYLVKTASNLARLTTQVDLGYETFIEPDDPKLVRYVQYVRRELFKLGHWDITAVPSNNLVVSLGSGSHGRRLLIQNYTPSQHHNLMEEPFSGRVASARDFGRDEPAVFGQGVSQAKAHQAVMLAVLKYIRDHHLSLKGRLYWAVNNEGRSSHACSTAIVAAISHKPTFGLIQLGTGLTLSLGNRGRVDIDVHVHGKAAHSSTPEMGCSAIDGAAEVIRRLASLQWPDEHPLLGGRQAIAYKVRYDPLAPHTLPSDAFITVDRRLLPGDDLELARIEIEAAIGEMAPFEVSVDTGVYMLPALVDPDHDGVKALAAAHARVVGAELPMVYRRGTFDAGGPTSLGIPTVMYGCSGGEWPLGVDFVTLKDLQVEASVLAEFILSYLN